MLIYTFPIHCEVSHISVDLFLVLACSAIMACVLTRWFRIPLYQYIFPLLYWPLYVLNSDPKRSVISCLTFVWRIVRFYIFHPVFDT